MAEAIPLFNARVSQDDDAALLRQEVTDSLHRSLTHALDGAFQIPVYLKEAFEREAWKRDRLIAGGMQRVAPVSFHEYVHAAYPVGLGTDFDTIRRFLGADIELLALYDRACQRPPGGTNNPDGRNQYTEDEEVIVDNIHGDLTAPPRPTGTSKQAGLRRLEKASEAGDPRARDLYEQVLKGELSVNAACLAMGWRKSLAALETMKRTWRKATPQEREEFRAWIDEQDSPMHGSRFA